MVDKKYVYCTAFIKGPGLTWVEFKKNRLAFSIVCTVHVREYQPIPISSVHQKHKRKPRNIRENLMPAVQSSDLFVLLKISKCQLNGPLALCHLSWEKDTHTHYQDTKNWHANCHFSARNIATRFSFAKSSVSSAMLCTYIWILVSDQFGAGHTINYIFFLGRMETCTNSLRESSTAMWMSAQNAGPW